MVEHLFTHDRIKEGTHFVLKDGYLFIRIQDIYHDYAKALQERRDPNMLDKSTLDKYLESDRKTFVARIKKSFGGKYSWCFQFKYPALGIDLIRYDDTSKLKAKHAEMGIDYLEEELLDSNLF